jgi:endonuclease-3 related protein
MLEALSTELSPAANHKVRGEDALSSTLRNYFQTLSTALGPMHWWPAKTPFEVIVGAILTQNTAWVNVERALANLRREQLLHPSRMERASVARLARLIRPSGYFRQKTKKLKAFLAFLRRPHSYA